MKFLVFIALLLLDFFSKKIIFEQIELNKFVKIFSFLDITHIHNYGISFGLFSGIIPAWTIIILGLLITFFISYLMFTSKNSSEKIGLLLIITGAASNLLDRINNNYVLDFIYLHYNNFYWPAFNFADIYITIGVIIVIYGNYILYRNKRIK